MAHSAGLFRTLILTMVLGLAGPAWAKDAKPPQQKTAASAKVRKGKDGKAAAPATPAPKPGTKTDPIDAAIQAKRQAKLPLAPTQKDVLQQRAAEKQAADAKADEACRSRGRLPTQLGDTSGPGAPQGAGTVHDRKAATIEASGPNPYGP